jgi:hypothetical protein
MHSAATWLELAAQVRSVADCLKDAASRQALLDIVAAYEKQAQELDSRAGAAWVFGEYPSRRG